MNRIAFEKEPASYEKTVRSDLQGAWQNLRDQVAEEAGFSNWGRVLFHIDETMSWESVRNLQAMHNCTRKPDEVRQVFCLLGGSATWTRQALLVQNGPDPWAIHRRLPF